MSKTNVVIVTLAGGLGNQLFQYAAARRLAWALKTELKLDIITRLIDRQYGGLYALDPFSIQAEIASPAEIVEAGGGAAAGMARLAVLAKNRIKLSLKWARGTYGPFSNKIFVLFHPAATKGQPWTRLMQDANQAFDERIMHAAGNVYLRGFWQSEKYFADIDGIIRKDLTVTIKPSPQNAAMAEAIEQTESVAIHIRRGDLNFMPERRQTQGICDENYYKECISRIEKTIANPHFYIFSDDAHGIMDDLLHQHPKTHVTHNKANRDYEDLRLMGLCKHQIIANSTFSWWAAWLNQNRNKQVFAPKKWFNISIPLAAEIIPDHWHTIG